MPNIAKKFYPEIQGIRAISIIAVILFHFGFHILPGGYVGVDMFFVISGYLITQMIAGELASGTFSIARFYKNRVVRLLPNLFLMIAASAVISYFVLKPYDFFQYAKSLQFSAIYLTNMVFARQQGYFDMSRDAKPLLHTWSLSIEEQFYLIFPVFLILLYKFKTHRIAALIVIAAASLWVRFDYIQHYLPTEGFFSFAGRIWEFIIGALAALMSVEIKNRLLHNGAISLTSLALIAASLLWLDESASPLLLLIPCLATALFILSSPNTTAGKWLSGKTLVFIGGLSYSLYLWHWPLIVWFHNADYSLNDTVQTTLLLFLTVLIAYLAWKYVEEPCRQRREKFSGKSVALLTASFAVFCIATGMYVYAKGGMEERFPSWVNAKNNLAAFDFKAATGTQINYPANCLIGDDPDAILKHCAFGDSSADNRFLLLGDSHTAAWYPAFQAAAEAMDAQGVLVTLPGCPPIFGISSFDGAKNICAEGFDRRIRTLIETRAFRKIFLVASWSMYTEGDPNNQPNHFISDATTSSQDAASSKNVISRHLTDTLSLMKAQGSEVVIVHSVPVLPKVIQNLPVDFTQPLAQIRHQNQFMTEFMKQNPNTAFIDPVSVFCDEQNCQTRRNGNILYGDNNHISPAGAALLVKLIERELLQPVKNMEHN